MHTNDTHSQVEPLEEGKRDALCGGYARRMGLINQERKKKEQDFFIFCAIYIETANIGIHPLGIWLFFGNIFR